MTNEREKVEEILKGNGYACSICGYSPTNRSGWCDLGCGSDYNKMINVFSLLEEAKKEAYEKGYEESKSMGWWPQRDEEIAQAKREEAREVLEELLFEYPKAPYYPRELIEARLKELGEEK